MFDSLAEKLQATLADVRGRGTLTEDDVSAAMREIRLGLLEADVNFKVVKSFTGAVKERALGADVIGQLNPGQQVVKIVSDELTELMGGAAREISFSPRPPTVIVMAGLQGSGKTTATAKLARYLRQEHGSSVAVAACDVYRPAAVDQLIKVGGQVGAEVYEQGTDRDPVRIAAWARDRAQSEGKDALIIDTSGRLHVDQEMMAELAQINKAVRPHDVLLVVDAMTGQDAVAVAEQFAEGADCDGVVLTKLDGDEREFDRLQAIILSMTPQERQHPELIKGSRRLRIARGSGTNVQAVKQLIKQFEQMRKVMRQVAQGRMPDLGALMRQAR